MISSTTTSDPKLLDSLISQLQDLSAKEKSSRKEEIKNQYKKEIDELKSKIDSIPSQIVPNFDELVIDFISKNIIEKNEKINNSKRDKSETIYFLEFQASEYARLWEYIRLWKKLLNEISESKKNEKNHWVVWMKTIFNDFLKDVEYTFRLNSQTLCNSTDIFANATKIAKHAAQADFLDPCDYFKYLICEIDRARIVFFQKEMKVIEKESFEM